MREKRGRRNEREKERTIKVSFILNTQVNSQRNSYCMYTTTGRMIRTLNVNRCTMAAEQDVVRRWARRERAWPPW